MLRRAFAVVTLIVVTASPAVTSTRLFCRYTGAEIVGCDESRIPAQAQLREEGCCLKRTFHALDATRILLDDGPRLATPPIGAIVVSIAEVPVLAPAPPARGHFFSDAGPPVFLTNRALLI